MKIHEQAVYERARADHAIQALDDLYSYVTSEKFCGGNFGDNMVNTADIVIRINEAKSGLSDAIFQAFRDRK